MKEKRIKVIIDRTGNYKIETLSGFAGNNCQKTVEEIAAAIGRDDDVETIFKLCEHLAGNSDRCVIRFVGSNPSSNKYQMVY